MPKLTWMNKSPPRVNYLAALLREYKRAAQRTSDDLAKELGCTPENIRGQIRKPAEKWTVGQLMIYCDLLQIPYEEAFSAAIKSRLPVGKTGKRQGK